MISVEKLLAIVSAGKLSCLRRSYLHGIILALAMAAPLSVVHAETVSDVRVLIDVSGSMKQNDPKNLRVPALRLLEELLPEGTRAGVWTFGQYVDMSVPLGKVDKKWREQARQQESKIHSRGLFTNIEEALRKSSVDWKNPDPKYRRHLILLTDGMVDVSKDPAESAKSRKRILEEILPALHQADVSVHTIALSKDADAELLQATATATGGAFSQVNNAEELHRIFLHLFEKAVGADTLPIQNNTFQVDKQISDITVLIFLAKDSPATQLTTPSKTVLSLKQHDKTVQWHHEEGYDLVTIPTPEAGTWQLQAKVDPDNRVVVVTNLRLKVDKMPNTLLLGDTFDVRARLLEDSKTITNPNLLEKTQFDLMTMADDTKAETYSLKDDGNAPDSLKGDGVFSLAMNKLERAGSYEFIVAAKGPTFAREIHHNLTVFDSPANIVISQEAAGKPFRVSVLPHAGLIRPETVSMQLQLPKTEAMTIAQISDSEWAIEVPPSFANQKFTLTLAATRYDDKPLKMEFEQVLAVTATPQSLAIKIAAHDEPGAAEQKTDQHDKAKSEENSKADAENTSGDDAEATDEGEGPLFDWKIVIGLVIGANALVFGGGWFIYRRLRKRRQQQSDKDVKEMQV